MILILPSDVQKTIFDLGLKEEYFKKDFTKYKVKDYGLPLLRNQLSYDYDFQKRLLKKTINKKHINTYRFKMASKCFIFYEKDEVYKWIARQLINKRKVYIQQ